MDLELSEEQRQTVETIRRFLEKEIKPHVERWDHQNEYPTEARDAFKELSRPMAMWVTMSKPAGVNVVFCSMAKGSWLQTDAKIRNPYYGAKMLSCGQIIGGTHKGKASGHMKH